MVSGGLCLKLLDGFLLAQQRAQPALERLEPSRRVAVVMALLALVLTGLALVACVMIGAHWVRRLARQTPQRSRSTDSSITSRENRSLRESLGDTLPEVEPGTTLHIDSSSVDTKVDP